MISQRRTENGCPDTRVEKEAGIFENGAPLYLPQLTEFQAASPNAIHTALERLKDFCQEGRRPPEGYLFALSKEISKRLQE